MKIPCNIQADQLGLSEDEERQYPRWYMDVLLRKGKETVAIGDVLSFATNFGLKRSQLDSILDLYEAPLVEIDPPQFYVFIRMASHLIQDASPLRPELAYISAPVPKPKSILSRKRKPNGAPSSSSSSSSPSPAVSTPFGSGNPFRGSSAGGSTAMSTTSTAESSAPMMDIDSFKTFMLTGKSPSRIEKKKKRVTFSTGPPRVAEAAAMSMDELLRQRERAAQNINAQLSTPYLNSGSMDDSDSDSSDDTDGAGSNYGSATQQYNTNSRGNNQYDHQNSAHPAHKPEEDDVEIENNAFKHVTIDSVLHNGQSNIPDAADSPKLQFSEHLGAQYAQGYLQPQGTGNGYLQPQGTGNNYLQSQGTGNNYLQPQGTGNNYLQSQGTGNNYLQSQGTGNGYLQPQGTGNNYLQSQGTGNNYFQPHGTGTNTNALRPQTSSQNLLAAQSTGQSSPFISSGQQPFRPQSTSGLMPSPAQPQSQPQQPTLPNINISNFMPPAAAGPPLPDKKPLAPVPRGAAPTHSPAMPFSSSTHSPVPSLHSASPSPSSFLSMNDGPSSRPVPPIPSASIRPVASYSDLPQIPPPPPSLGRRKLSPQISGYFQQQPTGTGGAGGASTGVGSGVGNTLAPPPPPSRRRAPSLPPQPQPGVGTYFGQGMAAPSPQSSIQSQFLQTPTQQQQYFQSPQPQQQQYFQNPSQQQQFSQFRHSPQMQQSQPNLLNDLHALQQAVDQLRTNH